jgi:Ulp1 family protease
MTEILNNKGGWLTALLTSAEEQQPEKSQWNVAQHGTYTVRISSMLTLRDKQWLNDEIINFYPLVILADKDEVMCSLDSTRTKSHFFGSFFLQQLYNDKHRDIQLRGNYNFNSTENTWNGQEKLSQCKNLFFVNNESNIHWTVIVLKIFTRRIIHYDSLTNRRNKNKGERMHSQKLDGILQYLD